MKVRPDEVGWFWSAGLRFDTPDLNSVSFGAPPPLCFDLDHGCCAGGLLDNINDLVLKPVQNWVGEPGQGCQDWNHMIRLSKQNDLCLRFIQMKKVKSSCRLRLTEIMNLISSRCSCRCFFVVAFTCVHLLLQHFPK